MHRALAVQFEEDEPDLSPHCRYSILRSGAFGLVILDLGAAAEIPIAVQGRLVSVAQHHDAAVVAITEKPDALWDRPDLERLYARLEDEYELQERVDTLNRKLAVIAETATTLADLIDTQRSLRLELIIVALIALEIVITFYQILASRAGH